MTAPDHPDWSVGTVSAVNAQLLASGDNVPPGTSYKGLKLPGQGTLRVTLNPASTNPNPTLGSVWVEQYTPGLGSIGEYTYNWALLNVGGQVIYTELQLPILGSLADIQYDSTDPDMTFNPIIRYSSVPTTAKRIVNVTEGIPGTIYSDFDASIAHSGYILIYLPPTSRSVRYIITPSAGPTSAFVVGSSYNTAAANAAELASGGTVNNETLIIDTIAPGMPTRLQVLNGAASAITARITVIDAS